VVQRQPNAKHALLIALGFKLATLRRLLDRKAPHHGKTVRISLHPFKAAIDTIAFSRWRHQNGVRNDGFLHDGAEFLLGQRLRQCTLLPGIQGRSGV
jgi:hypothetical protein